MTKDNKTPPAWQNERATGARKLEARPDLKNPDIIHTGDPDDEPRRPYGLTEPRDDETGDRGEALQPAEPAGSRSPKPGRRG